MSFIDGIGSNNQSLGFGSPYINSLAKKQKEQIVIPFKAASPEQAEKNYDQKVNKQQKIEQLKQMGFSASDLEFMFTIDDWGEVHVNPSKMTVTVGDLNDDRYEVTYDRETLNVKKQTQYIGKKKFVDEFKNGERIYIEYEKNDKGQYVKKHYERTPEDDYTKILESHNY